MSDRSESVGQPGAPLRRILLPLALAIGCTGARAPSPRPAPPAPDPCLLFPAPASPRASIRLALTDTVAPRHAPVAANDSERLIFRQLYDRLVELDCGGEPRPGLAESWRAEDDGRSWTLILRDGAAFWDGTPVTADEVIAAWRTTAERAALPIDPAEAIALDEHALRVVLPPGSGPSLLSHPDLAVVRRAPGRAWPEGTGAFRIEPRPGPAGGRLGVTAVPTLGGPEIRLESGADPRDLLDAGADLLSTRDPLAIEYSAALPGYSSRPLPWDRTYVLLSPEGSLELDRDAIEDLARDAVRGEARPAVERGWWHEMARCDPGTVAVTAPARPPAAIPARRLVYPQADRRAGELAERLVSIAGVHSELARPPAPHSVALGLSPGDLAAALAAGRESGYLLPLESRPLAPCLQAKDLLDRAPWLAERLAHPPLTALIETRARAIAREGMTAVWLDGHGTPLLAPPRRQQGGPAQ